MNSSKAKNVIKKYDAQTIAQVLNQEIPDLVIDSINIIEKGWDHVVAEINGVWIFRFPRTERSIAPLEREKKLLDYLKGHITLAIPDYHYVGTDTAFVGYRKIPGVSLTQQIYAGLDFDTRRSIAQTLATFLTQLHKAVNKDQALQFGYTNIVRPLKEIEFNIIGSLPTDISTMVQEAIAYAQEDLSKEENLVFIHQDVNGDNSAFNVTAGQIVGIFDFTDAAIGPRSWDFAELFFIDAELVKLTADIYAQMNNVPNPLVGGAADYILRKATLMLEAQKKGNAEYEKKITSRVV